MLTSSSHPDVAHLLPTEHWFRNKCGRGCGHIFEVVGPDDVLTKISKQVNEHWYECPRRLPRANSAVVTRGRLPISGLIHDSTPFDDEPTQRSWSSPSPSSSSSSTSARTLFSPVSASSSITGLSTPSPPPNAYAGLPWASPPPPNARRGGPSKKSARSEAERRLSLEADIWIVPGTVEPHAVVCRNCARRIKLDRRSRFYPGLWTKHRDRCCEGLCRMVTMTMTQRQY
ncbi:hypothetical protein FB45DRAFT_920108 [Roridomyces roridus]|uniref:Uncharacterized protein n=1 Tax=Roridomyces roridus TaxID=1738132 RepID=A0AAD7BP99_9AGAR|nr:hypothetical protein FB45DRAFT_920108 [Roridomyces roridus]